MDPEIVRTFHSECVWVCGSGVGMAVSCARAAKLVFNAYMSGCVKVRPPSVVLILPDCRRIQTKALFVEMPSKTSSPNLGCVRDVWAEAKFVPAGMSYLW